MYCDQCGTRLAEQAKFCHACGASVGYPVHDVQSEAAVSVAIGPANDLSSGEEASGGDGANVVIALVPVDEAAITPTTLDTNLAARQDPSPVPAPTPAHPSLACPRCGQIDRVLKVSAIVASGTTTGTTVGVGLGMGREMGSGRSVVLGETFNATTTSQSALAQRLAPPVRPSVHIPWWLAPGVVGLIVLAIVAANGGFAALFIGLAVASMFGGGGVAAYLIAIGAVGAWYFTTRARVRRSQEAFVAQNLPLWKTALATWQRLHYCQRCDGVFQPGRDAFTPTHSRLALLRLLNWREFPR